MLARTWHFDVDGFPHVLSYAPGPKTDWPDSVTLDNRPIAVRWRRSNGERPRGGAPGARATFDVKGHQMALEWVSDVKVPAWPRLFDRLVALGRFLLFLAMIDLPAGRRHGTVSLFIDNHRIAESQVGSPT